MGAVYFYHLTRRALDEVLPQLLDRSRSQGWRVLVRGRNPRAVEALDEALWLAGPDDGFRPHGMSGGEYDAAQPVLLTCDGGLTDGRHCLMSIEGAEVTTDEIEALDRVCVIFDGTDGGALERARAQWRELTRAGCAAQYWSEESGRWEKKAES